MNKAAQSLGRLGGLATAKRGRDYFVRISKLAKIAKQKKKDRQAKQQTEAKA